MTMGMVKIHNLDELTELAWRLWLAKYTDVFDFLRDGRRTVAVNGLSKALVGVDDNFVKRESAKHNSQVIKARNKYVIDVGVS